MKKCILTGLFLLISVLGFPQGVTNVGTDFWIAFPPNWQDGATIVETGQGGFVGFLNKFKTQAFKTDDHGRPK